MRCATRLLSTVTPDAINGITGAPSKGGALFLTDIASIFGNDGVPGLRITDILFIENSILENGLEDQFNGGAFATDNISVINLQDVQFINNRVPSPEGQGGAFFLENFAQFIAIPSTLTLIGNTIPEVNIDLDATS